VKLAFMPSQRDTARSGRKARKVLRALNAPMLPRPAPSAPRLTNDICSHTSHAGVKLLLD